MNNDNNKGFAKAIRLWQDSPKEEAVQKGAVFMASAYLTLLLLEDLQEADSGLKSQKLKSVLKNATRLLEEENQKHLRPQRLDGADIGGEVFAMASFVEQVVRSCFHTPKGSELAFQRAIAKAIESQTGQKTEAVKALLGADEATAKRIVRRFFNYPFAKNKLWVESLLGREIEPVKATRLKAIFLIEV